MLEILLTVGATSVSVACSALVLELFREKRLKHLRDRMKSAGFSQTFRDLVETPSEPKSVGAHQRVA